MFPVLTVTRLKLARNEVPALIRHLNLRFGLDASRGS